MTNKALLKELLAKVEGGETVSYTDFARAEPKNAARVKNARVKNWRHVAARRALTKEFCKVQEGKSLTILRKLLLRFRPLSRFDESLVATFREGLEWREAAKLNGTTYAVVESYSAMMRNRRREERA